MSMTIAEKMTATMAARVTSLPIAAADARHLRRFFTQAA
jgi:hypothetical protein